jgi:hypothetical protein
LVATPAFNQSGTVEISITVTDSAGSDTATINTISLNAGYSETVLVKVSVPVEGIPNGHAESISITTISQNDLNLSDPAFVYTHQLITAIPIYSFYFARTYR